MIEQAELPKEYLAASPVELQERIARRKAELGKRLCILGHHYQADEVFRFADFTGDSLKLSQQAASQKEAKYIVFCGVHFMAESADVLSGDEQIVCLPNLRAGCAMADMADDAAVATALEELSGMTEAKIVPVTYVNSSAAIKAITARYGGACCTSGNVANVFRWALAPAAEGGAGGPKILAIPDQHLGRNTAIALGYSLDDCALYNPQLPNGGLSHQDVQRATFLLWNGACHVHQLFTPEHVRSVRREHPDIQVIVHPECPHEVVQLADAVGSTEQILTTVSESLPGSSWAIGTESMMVNRLARRLSDRFIRTLSPMASVCWQMKRIDLPHLLWVLDNLAAGNVVNRVQVCPAVAADARVALQRMLGIKRVDGATKRSF